MWVVYVLNKSVILKVVPNGTLFSKYSLLFVTIYIKDSWLMCVCVCVWYFSGFNLHYMAVCVSGN